MSSGEMGTVEKMSGENPVEERELPPIPQRVLDSLGTPEKVAAAEKLWARLIPMAPDFAVAISNPPYQEDHRAASGKSVPRDLYHRFQEGGQAIAKRTSMIYPSKRWLQFAGKDTKQFGRALLMDPHLVRVDHYDNAANVFPGIGIQDGVAVVQWSAAHHDDSYFTLNGEKVHRPVGDVPVILDAGKRALVKRVAEKGLGTIKGRSLGRSLYGIESNHLKANPGSLVPVSKRSPCKESVRVFTIGAGISPEWFWMDRNKVPRGASTIDKWKVIISSSHPVRDYSFSRVILKPGEIHGRSRVSMAHFDTEEEAENYLRYTNTALFRALFSLSPDGLTQMGVFAPDLKDYTSNNPLFMEDEALGVEHEYHGLSLDERLVKYFSLTENELAAVKG